MFFILIIGAVRYRSSIFLTNIGKIIYPSYQITRNAVIYQDRDDVIMYDLANQNLCQMDDAIARRNFDEAQEVYERVHIHFVEALKKLANNDPQLIHVRFFYKLPVLNVFKKSKQPGFSKPAQSKS